VAVTGGALSALLARTHKSLCALIYLGAGTLLSVAAFPIGPFTFRHFAVDNLCGTIDN